MSIGARISLGPVQAEDLPLLHRWINDRNLVLLSAPYRPVHFSDHAAWWSSVSADRSVELFAIRAEAKNLELICRQAPDLPLRVIGDPGRLRQVLSNLLANAIKFTQQGHIYVDATCASSDHQSANLTISVSDTGIGIPAEKLEVIFEKFTQADPEQATGGLGLGLALSRQLAEALDGALEHSADAGGGARFTLTLPRYDDPARRNGLPEMRRGGRGDEGSPRP